MLDFSAGLIDKQQQGVGDAPFDLLGRYLDYRGYGFLEAGTDGLQRISGEYGNFSTSRGQVSDNHASTMLSSTAVAVAG